MSCHSRSRTVRILSKHGKWRQHAKFSAVAGARKGPTDLLCRQKRARVRGGEIPISAKEELRRTRTAPNYGQVSPAAQAPGSDLGDDLANNRKVKAWSMKLGV